MEGARRATGVNPEGSRTSRCLIGKALKFADEQKFDIALDLISANLSHSEICRKYDISATYAYRLKDRGLVILRAGIDRPPGKPDAEVERLRKHVADLEQLAGD